MGISKLWINEMFSVLITKLHNSLSPCLVNMVLGELVSTYSTSSLVDVVMLDRQTSAVEAAHVHVPGEVALRS